MDQIQNLNRGDLNFFLNQNVQIDIPSFILSLFCAVILSFFVQLFYIKYSSTLSNRKEFSKIFVILAVTTCIVIMIVKSSLALSLGLVGALSIVRFRAAIKEPEELVYLFLIIAIGLGCGANQLIITSVGIIFALILIMIYSGYMKNSRKDIEQTINLGVIIEQEISDLQINDLISEIKKHHFDFNLVNLQYGNIDNEISNLSAEDKSLFISHEIDLKNDFKSVFMLTNQCDYVISIGNALAHIAGTLDKKTFILIPEYAPRIWYWHNQEKSIWYKNMRLFFYNKTNLNYLISKICKSILAELT